MPSQQTWPAPERGRAVPPLAKRTGRKVRFRMNRFAPRVRALRRWRQQPWSVLVAISLLPLASWACGPDAGQDGARDVEAASAGQVVSSPEILVFPSATDWPTRSPREAGFDPEALQAAVDYTLAHETAMPGDPGQYLRDRFEGQPFQEIVGPTQDRGGVNGVIVKDGYVVAQWGDTDRVDMTFSVTKSYLSTVAGLAFDRGLIRDLDDLVVDYVADGTFQSEHNAGITWRMLLQQTSEWEGTLWDKPDQADRRMGIDRELGTPGTFWEYNDVRVNLLAYALLHIWRRPLPEVLKDEIMDPIGASANWRWHGYETSWTEIDGRRLQSVSGGGHWGSTLR